MRFDDVVLLLVGAEPAVDAQGEHSGLWFGSALQYFVGMSDGDGDEGEPLERGRTGSEGPLLWTEAALQTHFYYLVRTESVVLLLLRCVEENLCGRHLF